MSRFKRYADVVAKLRVPCGFVLVATFAWLSRPAWESLVVGLPVSVAGLMLRGWAAGHLEKNQTLTQSGPYSLVRNPLYIGTSLVAAGLVIASRRWVLAAIFAAVFLLVYLPVIELEEQHLRGLFPEFEEYSRRVPKLIPFGKGGSLKAFRWPLYRRNREYEALAGFAAGVLFLVAKAWWLSHS
jgi:protein-S-isoprenylcysteine O-methyltransferase Ste14